MPGAEKFGDMAVNGSKAVVGLALEQFGRSGEPKQIEANSVTFIYCGVILARLSETRCEPAAPESSCTAYNRPAASRSSFGVGV